MLLFNMISVSLVVAAAFSVIYFATYSSMERENERRLQAMSAISFLPNRPFPGSGERPAVRERFGADYRVSFVLLTQNGKLENVSSHLDFEDVVYEEALAKTREKSARKITLGGRKWAFMTLEAPGVPETLPPGGDSYEQIVFLDITTSAETLRILLVTLVCVGLAVLLVLLWFSFRFAAAAVRPIEESYNRQKQFVADASHELRTPLAIIGANIDAIETNAGESVESQREWLGYIRTELKRTGKLVDDLLYLAKAESAHPDENLPFNLSLACETVCASMEAVLYERGIRMDTEIRENIIIPADGDKIMRVLYILLDNAGKYTPRGGYVVVSLGAENDRALVRVANTGEGISKADLPKIFDRFYRPDASRSQETGGFGLGLSIAKTIVERSGGEITAANSEGMTVFTVRLKLI